MGELGTPPALTVEFRLKEGHRSMLYAFANPFNSIYCAARLKEDPNFPARHVLGSGPFRLAEHIAGSHWRGERFEGYFKPGLPHLHRLHVLFLQRPPPIHPLQSAPTPAPFA